MKSSAKTLRLALIGLGLIMLVVVGVSIVALERVTEFCYAEDVKGYWASLQGFVNKNGRYPKDDAEVRAFFRETPEQLRTEPAEYVAPQDTNADNVVLWWKKKTIFGVRVGITESGAIVRQR